jgi:hypothetical protein
MSEAAARPARGFLPQVCALIIGCVLAIVAFRTLSDQLWSDELLTTHLLRAGDLPKLWSGIALGIDGNPPLYLTAAWLIIRPLPEFVSSVAVLELINLALAAAAVVVLCQMARRIVPARACWLGAMLFVALNDGFLYVASELRTYALYFLMAALAVLFQQRLIERRRLLDVVLLALIYLGLAMAHTFGIVYVGCIALAGWLSQPRGDQPLLRPIALAVAPAIIAMCAWSPFLLEQLEVAKPYNWVPPPSLSRLVDTLFSSDTMLWLSALEAVCLAGAGAARLKDARIFRAIVHDPRWQPVRFVALMLTGITGFTLAGWLASWLLFPMFVQRFFTPQIIAAFVLHAAFSAWLLRYGRQHRLAALAIFIVFVPLMLRNALIHARYSTHGGPICADASGKFFESAFVHGDLPVIADSTHMFLPRASYADHGAAYRFPLDWDMVLNYPHRSSGNAVDYHIMQGLQSWEPMPQVESTEDIVRKYPQFLVVEQPNRAWFHHLTSTRKVTAEKLAQTTPADVDDISCTLWKVTRVEDRP